jgi:hypothetical protein
MQAGLMQVPPWAVGIDNRYDYIKSVTLRPRRAVPGGRV